MQRHNTLAFPSPPFKRASFGRDAAVVVLQVSASSSCTPWTWAVRRAIIQSISGAGVMHQRYVPLASSSCTPWTWAVRRAIIQSISGAGVMHQRYVPLALYCCEEIELAFWLVLRTAAGPLASNPASTKMAGSHTCSCATSFCSSMFRGLA